MVAVSAERDGLDTLIGPAIQIIDSAGLTVLPAFDDTHTHLMAATRAVHDVPLEQARSLSDCIELIRARGGHGSGDVDPHRLQLARTQPRGAAPAHRRRNWIPPRQIIRSWSGAGAVTPWSTAWRCGWPGSPRARPALRAGSRFLGEQHRRGTLAPGMLADLVAYPADPFTAPIGTVAGLRPDFTVIGGRPVHDLHGLLRRDHADGVNNL